MEPLSARLAALCANDGEFRLAARYWTGSLAFDLGDEGDEKVELVLTDGAVSAGESGSGASKAEHGRVAVRAPAAVWAKLLAPVPPPRYNDIVPAQAFGLVLEGEPETFWQYYPAVRRAVDLLRQERTR